jgi:hypothetical protein
MNHLNKIESFNEQPNFMLNLCQAAQVLGYKDYRKVESFIKSGVLKAYTLPHAKRKKVKYHEVMNLAKENKDISP